PLCRGFTFSGWQSFDDHFTENRWRFCGHEFDQIRGLLGFWIDVHQAKRGEDAPWQARRREACIGILAEFEELVRIGAVQDLIQRRRFSWNRRIWKMSDADGARLELFC